MSAVGRLEASVPGTAALKGYQRGWLVKDVVAGLVLSALLVPQGMAYAELAGLPPITGLYTSILCLLGYAVFGPSRILVLGPDSSLGPMIAATIAPLALAGGDPARAVALASLLGVIVGVLMTAAGLAKFGFVADLLSKPTQIGYMNGLALTIVIGQLPKLLGFSVDADGLIKEAKGFVTGLADGEVERHRRHDRPRVAGRHPGAAAAAAPGAGRAGRGRPGVGRGQRLEPGGARGGHDRGAAQWLPPVHDPHRPLGRPAPPRRGRAGDLPGRPGRHDVDRLLVRSAARRGRARQPGDGGDRCGQHRRRLLPGLPGEHQRLPHRGRRAVRVEVAADRGRRGRDDHADPGPGAVAHAVRPPADPRCRGHRSGALAGGPRRHEAPVAAAPDGVRAVGPGVPRGGAAGRAPRHPGRGRPVDPERLPSGLVAAPGRSSARSRRFRACTTPASTPMPGCCPGWSCSASTPR